MFSHFVPIMSVALVFSSGDDDEGPSLRLRSGWQFHLVPCVTAGRPSRPWDGDVFSTRLITARIMAISGRIGGQVGQIVWRAGAE